MTYKIFRLNASHIGCDSV